MTRSDLAAYTAPQQAPTTIDYRGYQIDGMGPPSSGGSTVGEALNILAGYHLGGRDRGLALFRYLEASRLSFADRNRYLGDANFVDVPLRGLLSPTYAATRRCLIGTTALTSPVPPGNPHPPFGSACGDTAGSGGAGGDEGTSTNHITVADRFGNVVSYTNTIEQIAGDMHGDRRKRRVSEIGDRAERNADQEEEQQLGPEKPLRRTVPQRKEQRRDAHGVDGHEVTLEDHLSITSKGGLLSKGRH